jgi:protein gp37
MSTTKIEWTDVTWNPVTGCTKISPGCEHCYAERMSKRLKGRYGYPADEPFRVTLHPDKLEEPLHWRKPKRVFVCSMGDLFHEDVPDRFIEAVFGIISLCGQHVFQVLTKRPERALEWFGRSMVGVCQAELCVNGALRSTAYIRDTSAVNGTPTADHRDEWPLPNVWLGVTAEDQQRANERIPTLLQIPAAGRFVSIEPMLGAIHLMGVSGSDGACWNTLRGHKFLPQERVVGQIGGMALTDYPCVPTAKLDWVILGGESGPGARPMHPDWARKVRDDCQAAGVPFYFKQWGEWGAGAIRISDGHPVFRMFANKMGWEHKGDTWVNGGTCIDTTGRTLTRGGDFDDARYPVAVVHKIGKKRAGRVLDGQTWEQMPEVKRC